jgi:hypothetical protein
MMGDQKFHPPLVKHIVKILCYVTTTTLVVTPTGRSSVRMVCVNVP